MKKALLALMLSLLMAPVWAQEQVFQPGASAGGQAPCNAFGTGATNCAPGSITATGGSVSRPLVNRAVDQGLSICEFASCSGATTTTGAITTGTAALTGAPTDFVNGQGILVSNAGAAYALGALGTVTATVVNPNAYATSQAYVYKVAAYDFAGGVGIAVASGSVNAPLRNKLNALKTYNGLTFTAVTGAAGYAIWQSLDGGTTYTFLGTSQSAGTVGSDGTYVVSDFGQTPPARPFWIPATPPAATTADWLLTTVSSGGGSSSLTLAANAGTTASSATITHDDTTAATAWGAYLNANAPMTGYCPATATVRLTSVIPAFTANGIRIIGQSGCTFAPTMNEVASTIIGLIQFSGAVGVSGTLASDFLEGSRQFTVSSVPASWAVGSYIQFIAPAPGNASAAGQYSLITQIVQIDGTTISVADPANRNYDTADQTATVGGTFTTGDTLTLTFSGGVTATVTYTLLSGDATGGGSCGGPTNGGSVACVAQQYALSANTNATMITNGITFDNSQGIVTVHIPSSLAAVTITPSVGGAVTETFVAGSPTAPTAKRLIPILDSSAQNLTFDFTNSAGSITRGINTNGGALHGLYMLITDRSSVYNILGKYVTTGSVVNTWQNYRLTEQDITSYSSGSGTYDAIEANYDTRSSIRNWRSEQDVGFGLGFHNGSYFSIANVSCAGAQAGRCFKTLSDTYGTVMDLDAEGASYTCAGITSGDYKLTYMGIRVSGCNLSQGDGQNFWVSNQWNTFNKIYGLVSANGGTQEIFIGPTDTNNQFINTFTTGNSFALISNWGSATFLASNGCALPAVGHAGANGSPQCQTTTSITTGVNNTIYGVGAGTSVTSANSNAIYGQGAGILVNGGSNTIVGVGAGTSLTSATSNVIVGRSVASTTLLGGGGDILIGTSSAVDTPASGTANAINFGNVITGDNGPATHPTTCAIGQACVLGVLRAANFNITTDQAIVIRPLTSGSSTNNGYMSTATKYRLSEIWVTNCSTSLTTAQGGFYTATSKGGTIIGAVGTAYTGCTGATTLQKLSGLINQDANIFSSATLYLSLTTAQGGAATGDVYLLGYPIN